MAWEAAIGFKRQTRRGAAIAVVTLLTAWPIGVVTTGVAAAEPRAQRPIVDVEVPPEKAPTVTVQVPLEKAPTVRVQTPDDTEGEIVTGLAAIAAAAVGGFLTWLATIKGEQRRQAFTTTAAQEEAVLSFGDAVLAYAEALGNEVNAADPQLQLKSYLETERAARRVLDSRRRLSQHDDLKSQGQALIEQRMSIRRCPTVTEKGVVLEKQFKPAIILFLESLTAAVDQKRAAA